MCESERVCAPTATKQLIFTEGKKMNTIPPLVCNTPPPIDEVESDEDLSAPNDNYDLDGMIGSALFYK